MSIAVLNTDAGLSGKTIQDTESSQTVTGLKTFDRDPSAPFAVSSGSAAVANLDADKLDGQEGSYYTNADNLASGTVPTARLGSGTPSSTTYLRGDQTWASLQNPVTVLDKDVTVAEVVSSVAETAVYSYSVPGGTLSTNKQLRLVMYNDLLNNTGSDQTCRVRVKYGATTIYDSAATIYGTSASRRGQKLEVILSALNATNAQAAFTTYFQGPSTAAGVTGTNGASGAVVGAYSAIAEDSTAAKTFQVTAELGANSASLSFKCHFAFIELLG